MPVLCEHTEIKNDLPLLAKENENQKKIPRRVSSPGLQSLNVVLVGDQQRPLKSCMSVPSLEQSLLSYTSKGDSSKDASKPGDDGIDTKIKRSVSFHSVQVREYSMTLGDHPAAKSGPPVTLSWNYNPSHAVVSVDDFETYRPPRRSRSQIYIPPRRREDMLRNDLGIGNKQLQRARVEVSKIREQRQKTVATLHNAHVEEAMEKARRKIKRFVSRKSKEKEEEQLWIEAEKIAEQKRKAAREKTKLQQQDIAGDQQSQESNEFQPQEKIEAAGNDEGAKASTLDDTVDDEGPLSF